MDKDMKTNDKMTNLDMKKSAKEASRNHLRDISINNQSTFVQLFMIPHLRSSEHSSNDHHAR